MSLAAPKNRIAAIDIARGGALIAMAIYHFTWDLEFFGWLLPGTSNEIGWRLFARSIATSFLFLVGVSLVLAHGLGRNAVIRWKGFFKRLGMVSLAAALISLVTYFAVPGGFIFFGILHAIALFSLIAVFLLRLPYWANLLIAAAIFALAEPLRNEALGHPALYWLGLSINNPVSNDYVPLFPWLSATILGLGIAQWAETKGWFNRWRGRFDNNRADRTIGFLGRHSLAFYLLHQPILLASIWALTQIIGPPNPAPAFLSNCERACVTNNEKAYCTRFCGCMLDELKAEKLFTPFLQGKIDLETHEEGNFVLKYCSAR